MSVARLRLAPVGEARFAAVPAPAPPRTRVRNALGAATRDFWDQSWRLALLNTVFSFSLALVVIAVAHSLLALALVPLLGVAAIALAHCTVKLAHEGDLKLADAVEGVRRHWRRGAVLGVLVTLVVAAGAFAIADYGSRQAAAWPLAFVAGYLLAAFALLQLHLWPLAAAHPEESLRALLTRTGTALVRRPGPTLRLGLVLLVVNLLGLAAAVMPFLTLTIAYSFLAAAHFAVPPEHPREV
jgi:hypothetical protein